MAPRCMQPPISCINILQEACKGKHHVRSQSKKDRVQQAVNFVTTECHLTLHDCQKIRSLSNNIPSTQYGAVSELGLSIRNDDNTVWTLSQMYALVEQKRPTSWNNFFKLVGEAKLKTVIAYGPTFPQSPTQPDVVQASLDYYIALTKTLGQESVIVSCDQAIYDIVKGKYHSHKVAL